MTAIVLLVAAALSISAFSLALSGWNGVSWAGNPTLFFWNTLPVFLLLGLHHPCHESGGDRGRNRV